MRFFLLFAVIAFEYIEILIDWKSIFVCYFYVFTCRESVKCVVQLYCIKLHFRWRSNQYWIQKKTPTEEASTKKMFSKRHFAVLTRINDLHFLARRWPTVCTVTDSLRKKAAIHPGLKSNTLTMPAWVLYTIWTYHEDGTNK